MNLCLFVEADYQKAQTKTGYVFTEQAVAQIDLSTGCDINLK